MPAALGLIRAEIALNTRPMQTPVGRPPRPRAAGRRRRLLELGAAALVGGTLTACVLYVTHAQAKTQWDNPYFPFEQLGRVLTWVENEYVDPVERRRLVEGAIQGMVAELTALPNVRNVRTALTLDAVKDEPLVPLETPVA